MSPYQRVIVLSGVLVAVALLSLGAATARGTALQPPFKIPWWAFAPAIMAAEALIFHIERRRQTHSFNLSEIPLVIGFFFAAPWAVMSGRLLGHLVYRGAFQRQAPRKLLLNMASFAAESGLAILVFRYLSGHDTPLRPVSWAIIFVAIVVADTVSMIAVTAAIRWHGGETQLQYVIVTGIVTAVLNTSLSVLAVIALWVSPWAILVLGLVVAIVAVLYRRYAALTQRHSSLQMLYTFTRMVSASLNAEFVTDEVLCEARKLLRAATAEIILIDEPSGACSDRFREQERADSTDAQLAMAPGDLAYLADEAVFRKVVDENCPLVVPRGSRDPDHLSYLSSVGVADCMVAPLLADNRVVGTIMVADRVSNVSTFDEQDLQIFATLANHASVAFENGRLVEKLRQEAHDRRYEALHDSLTGLPNRSLFIQRVDELTGNSASLGTGRAAVMLMDLDRFKEVNDTLGHHNGDLLLQEVAARLVGALRQDDTVARLGGDEFAILLRRLTSTEEALETAQRIISALEEPFRLESLSVDVGASVGIAVFPEHGGDAATLLQRADVAMYEAKASEESISVYSSERDHNTPDRLSLAAELRHAISDGQIVVYYQPKARLSDGLVVGTEALVRWQHPQRGLLPPDDFIPIAEQTGLIAPLTLYALREALQQCRRWNDAGLDLGVAVNLALRCLVGTDLPQEVASILAETGVPSSRLTLEITESGVMGDPQRSIAVLERLAALGVKLSIDDFGTGYSSLSYLRTLPVHEVKIDQSFVQRLATDPSDAAILQSVVELGHNLGLITVAEGVEDKLSWDLLRSMGCGQAQGYYLSPPIPADMLTRWIETSSRYRPTSFSGPAVHDRVRSVLVVDDDRSLRGVVRHLLDDKSRYRVHEAGDGWEAIVLARRFQPDIIILDLVMPKMSGVDALQSIRSVSPSSRVVILSAAIDPGMIAAATRNGAVEFLDKAQDLLDLPDRLDLLIAS